eukprot:5077418-Heterocapsa_arctica.AAC.1
MPAPCCRTFAQHSSRHSVSQPTWLARAAECQGHPLRLSNEEEGKEAAAARKPPREPLGTLPLSTPPDSVHTPGPGCLPVHSIPPGASGTRSPPGLAPGKQDGSAGVMEAVLPPCPP